MTRLPILCVGALTLDTIFDMAELPAGPGKFIPRGAVQNAAGMASSAATAIARLGGRAALWASVGNDAVGARLVREIAGEGVDCLTVRVVAGARSAFATILVDPAGDRVIVPQYDPELLSDPLDLPDTAAGCAAVMADVRWPLGAMRALAAAGQAGMPAILDADVAPVETLDFLLPLATHVVTSEPAAERLTGAGDPTDAVRRLAERHPGFVAVTAGRRGVHWLDRENATIRHCPAPQVVVKDTLAAGDVFHGAFALGLVEGWPMARVMAFASMAAAIKCERFGGRLGAPTRAEVDARMSAG